MIYDLNHETKTNLLAKFVIIGGGTAGLLLAAKLAELEIGEVIVLELGGERISKTPNMFPKVEFSRSIYQGAEAGRFAGLGGTSARWGGAMIPFLCSDFEGEYRNLIAEANSYIFEIEKLFSLPVGPYIDGNSIEVPNYVTRKAKWPAFSKRNVARLFSREIKYYNNLIVYTNAKVVDIDEPKLEEISVNVENNNGKRFIVSCEKATICAGAIESTRMLLEIEEKFRNSNKKINESTTGLYFSDHLSVKIAEIVPKNKSKLNMLVGYRFSRNGSMSNIRFELQEDSELRKVLPPHFVHISFDTSTPGAFSFLREIYRELQEGKFPSVKLFRKLLKYLPWMLRAGWWRFIKNRLLYPDDSKLEMHLVFEQSPNPKNRLLLKNRHVEENNEPTIEISWGVSSEDESNLNNILMQFKSLWVNSKVNELAETIFLDGEVILNNLAEGGGIFHPTGSTRIKFKDSLGSVDANLKVEGFRNLYLLSTSVLNFGGGANPTMTEMMLGLRLVEHFASLQNSKLIV